MSVVPLLLLFIISVFTMNLTLQCALGIKGAAESKKFSSLSALTRVLIIFVSVVLLWFFFSRIIFSVIPGLFIYVILFPVSYMVYHGLEHLFFFYILKKQDNEEESAITFPGGITAAAVFICVNIASGILETLILSFGFSAGIFLVFLIIREIRKRAALEKVPQFIRGKPLVLIAMGLLSLIFSVSSLLFLGMFNAR